jgi:hypothetical protein
MDNVSEPSVHIDVVSLTARKKELKEALRFRLVKRVVATAVAETKKSTYFTHEDRIPLVARFSVPVRAGLQGPPSLLFSGG